MASKRIPKNIKFEQALQELEAQVQLLESNDLPLEQALDAYKYGVELSKVCLEKLETVKKEVAKVVVQDEENYTLESFDEEEEE